MPKAAIAAICSVQVFLQSVQVFLLDVLVLYININYQINPEIINKTLLGEEGKADEPTETDLRMRKEPILQDVVTAAPGKNSEKIFDRLTPVSHPAGFQCRRGKTSDALASLYARSL